MHEKYRMFNENENRLLTYAEAAEALTNRGITSRSRRSVTT